MYFYFDTAARVFVLINWAQDTTLSVWLHFFRDSLDCMILMKEFVSLTTVAMEIGERHDQWKMLQEEKYLFKNMNLTDGN